VLWLPRIAVGDADGPGDTDAFGGGADGGADPDDGAVDAEATAADGAAATVGDAVV